MSRLISSCQFTKHDFCDYLFGFNFFLQSSHEQMYKNDFFINFFGFNLLSFRQKIKKNFSMTGKLIKKFYNFLINNNIIYNDL